MADERSDEQVATAGHDDGGEARPRATSAEPATRAGDAGGTTGQAHAAEDATAAPDAPAAATDAPAATDAAEEATAATDAPDAPAAAEEATDGTDAPAAADAAEEATATSDAPAATAAAHATATATDAPGATEDATATAPDGAPAAEEAPAPDGADAPAHDGAPAATDQEAAHPVATGPETIEWQPVVAGDQIEWQPVVIEPEPAPSAGAGWEWEPEVGTGHQPDFAVYDEGPIEVEPEAEAEAESAGELPARAGARKRSSVGVWLGVGAVLVVLMAVIAFVLVSSRADDVDQAAPPASTIPQADFVEWRDEETGISLRYPRSWQRLQSPVAERRLILNAGGGDGMWVSVTPRPLDLDTKALARQYISSEPTNQIVAESDVDVSGITGHYFLYTFQDTSGVLGAHGHFFLPVGNWLVALVFQAVPFEDFRQLGPIFDQIAESFAITGPPPEATSTAPPPTPTTVP